MLIDTHAHVQFEGFKDDYKEVLARAKEAGVLVVNVGTQLDTSQAAIKMAEDSQMSNAKGQVFAVVGLHPVHTYSQHVDEEETHFKTREEKFDYEAYKKLAQHPLVVGIGECGLDYYRLPLEGNPPAEGSPLKTLQKEAFIAQIRLAKEVNKALVIHCRPSTGTQDAYEDILQILDQEGVSGVKGQRSKVPFEIHSYTGSVGIVQQFIDRGAYVGLNGIITFDKTGNMEQVVKVVPIERIVLETDCPYLTPLPHRGKKNEPAYVEYVAQKVAEVKGLTVDDVAGLTTQNAQDLFGLR